MADIEPISMATRLDATSRVPWSHAARRPGVVGGGGRMSASSKKSRPQVRGRDTWSTACACDIPQPLARHLLKILTRSTDWDRVERRFRGAPLKDAVVRARSISSTASMQSAITGSVIGWRASNRSVPPIPQRLEGRCHRSLPAPECMDWGMSRPRHAVANCNCSSPACATRIQWGWGLYRSQGEIRAATSSGRYRNEPARVLDTHHHPLSSRRAAGATGGPWRRVLYRAGEGERLDSAGCRSPCVEETLSAGLLRRRMGTA